MSFETKYKHSFKDYYNRSWELHLKKEDYSGTIYNLSGTADPVKITDPNQGASKLTPIRGTELRANLIIDTGADYNFKDDFWGITDREWQAILYRAAASTYLAECEITNFNVTNTAVDAQGSIEITNIGDLAVEPTCDCEFAIFKFPDSGTEDLSFYAVPKTEDNQYSGRKLLNTVTVYDDDTTEDIIDRVATLADWTKIDAQTLRYTQTTYDEDIDSSWNIRLLYREDEYKPYTEYLSGKGFSGATEKQWIKLDLISKNPNLSNPTITNLGTWEHIDTPLETTAQIAQWIVDQLDGIEVTNVYHPPTESRIDIEFSAYRVNSVAYIKLLDIGTKGNYFDIKSSLENDTYLRIHKRTGSDYAWTDVDFTGGTDGGDEFLIEVDKGSGFETLSSVIAISLDTEARLINKIINDINDNSSTFFAEVDPSNSSNIRIISEDASGWNYRFTTDGGSTVTPTTSTAFEEISDTQLYWSGWVVPEIYEQDHLNGKVFIDLSAVDGLGDLKNFEFTVGDRYPFEPLSFMDILTFALRKTGFNFLLEESFHLWHLQGDSSLSPLTQVYQESARLNGRTCYEVLEEVLPLLQASVCQINGRWHLLPLSKHDTSYTNKVFDSFGNFLESNTRSGFIKETGGVTRDNIFIDRNTKIAFEPGFRKVEIKQDYGFVNQMVLFPSFNSINDNLNNVQYPWKWMYDNVIQGSFLGEIYKREDGSLFISNNSAHSSERFYLYQKLRFSEIEVANSDEKQYELKITYLQEFNAADEIKIRIWTTDGTNTVYLSDFSETSPFSTIERNIELEGNTSSKQKTFSISFDYPRKAGLLTSTESDLHIEIYQPESDYILIKSLEITLNTIAVTGKKVSSYFEELKDNLSSEIYEKDVNLGDIPDIQNAVNVYKNSLFYFDGDENKRLTSVWVEDPDSPTGQKSLIAHYRKFLLDQYPTGIFKITGSILGQLNLRDIIKDKSNSDKLFMLTGGELNIKKCILSGEWIEIAKDTSSYTLVEDTTSYEEESSGSNTYSTISGGGEETEVDLSNYYTKSETESLIVGKVGRFTGGQMTDNSISIVHNLAINTVILYLYDMNNKLINASNYEVEIDSINQITVTLYMPIGSTDEIKYRVL